MSFPWIFQANFEAGSNAEWDSETDTASQLDFPHYKELARFPWKSCVPYSGAYCMRVTLSGGTADAFVLEGDINIAANTTRHVRFAMWLSPTFTATADDTINIFEAQETGNASMAAFGLRVVAATNVVNLGIGLTAPTTFSSVPLERGVWYTIELVIDIDNAGSNDGTIDLYVTKDGDKAATVVHAAQVVSLDQTEVTHGVLGVQNHLATTTGVILFDDFIMDDARVYPQVRYLNDPVFTASGHAFVGPGTLSGAALLTNETTNTMILWDTDVADTTASQSYTVFFDLDNQTSVGGNINFQKGCYVQLSGTTPIGQVMLSRGGDGSGLLGPLYYSDEGVKRWGQR